MEMTGITGDHSQRATVTGFTGDAPESVDLRSLSPIRVLALGQDPRMVGPLRNVQWITEPGETHDVVLLRGPMGAEHLANYRLTSASPAALVAVTDSRSDLYHDLVIGTDLAQLTDRLIPLVSTIAKLRMLPSITTGPDRDATLIMVLAATRELAFSAQWQPTDAGPIGYPNLAGMRSQRALLEQLADARLLQREFFERLHLCGHCESPSIHAREVCISCGHSNLTEEKLIHHYACAHQGAASLFEREDGLTCPKCNKALRHYGVDYDKPGHIVTCGRCQQSMSEPDVAFVCAGCGESTGGDDAPTRTWHHYQLTEEGRRAGFAASLPNRDKRRLRNAEVNSADWQAITNNHLQIAERSDRPLTVLTLAIDTAEGIDPLPQRRRHLIDFLTKLSAEAVRRGDLVCRHGEIVLACLPETDRGEALVLVDRLQAAFDANVSNEFHIDLAYVERDAVAELLEQMR
ncbi:MAG: hypothetical protein AB8B93_08075 [Pseudomonadales bacterium]